MVNQFFSSHQGGKNKKICLIHLHGDEKASQKLAQETREELECGLLLCRSDTKYVKLSLGDGEILIDPNRIWTSSQPLELPNKVIVSHAESHALYQAIREQLFWPACKFITSNGFQTLIALHNNGKSNFSFVSFTEGEHKKQARETFFVDKKNPGDFILATKEEDYRALENFGKFNAALLASEPNDGSLSVWAKRKGKRYLNIEALSRKSLEETIAIQRNMLEKVLSQCKIV